MKLVRLAAPVAIGAVVGCGGGLWWEARRRATGTERDQDAEVMQRCATDLDRMLREENPRWAD